MALLFTLLILLTVVFKWVLRKVIEGKWSQDNDKYLLKPVMQTLAVFISCLSQSIFFGTAVGLTYFKGVLKYNFGVHLK